MKRLISLSAFLFLAWSFAPSGCTAPCDGHDDCGSDELCVFSTGRCSAKCSTSDASTCGASATCDACATSSCPTCEDCAAACVPVSGQGAQGGW